MTRKEAAGAGVTLPLVRVRKLPRPGLGRVTAGWSHGRRPGPREAASGMRGMFLTVAARVPPRPARRHNRHDPHTCLRVLCLNSDCRDILKIQLSMGLYSDSCVQIFSTIKAYRISKKSFGSIVKNFKVMVIYKLHTFDLLILNILVHILWKIVFGWYMNKHRAK